MEADLPSGARAATAAGLDFDLVRTERPSSAEESARLQGIRLEQLLRTIVVRRGEGDYVFVLVPGGRQIEWPKLRAHLGVRRISLPDRDEAREATGYERARSRRSVRARHGRWSWTRGSVPSTGSRSGPAPTGPTSMLPPKI
jgi:aminoacyl-tRNA editing protein